MIFKRIYLSHIITSETPSYGNKNRFQRQMISSIQKGDIANESRIETNVHMGTHIDMPFHFYDNGQTIENYDADFWFFNRAAMIEIEPKSQIIYKEVIEALEEKRVSSEIEILLVKTGIEKVRTQERFWAENPGFSPQLYDYFIENFPKLRIFGFDSISVSSFTERVIGREAHKRFLNPSYPILLLEDMNLENLTPSSKIKEIFVSPLRVGRCDGLPCTVVATLEG